MQMLNNVGLDDNKRLAQQLGAYQSVFRKWWSRRGPGEFLDRPMRLRCPTGDVGRRSWSKEVVLAPSDYQWGIFQAPLTHSAIGFGDNAGGKLWGRVPEEYHYLLLDHVVMQADAENGSIEQSRNLTSTAPSAIDLEHLFQFFLEEGRHSWSMVHLMLEHFGEDGVVESEALLERMCGEASNPRLLNAFNLTTEDWLSHFMWCFLADRNGKYQVEAVSRSAFMPLAKSASYMMYEEPLHVRFGAEGLERILVRSAQVTLERDRTDIFEYGAIPFPVIQRQLNFWASAVYDLFGNDVSTHAATMFDLGIRTPRYFTAGPDQQVFVDNLVDKAVVRVGVEARLAINAVMRRQFVEEVEQTITYWNDCLARLGIDFRLRLPHERFNRQVGPFKGIAVNPNGELVPTHAMHDPHAHLPTAEDKAAIASLMKRVLAPGECAEWIAQPNSRLRNLVAVRA